MCTDHKGNYFVKNVKTDGQGHGFFRPEWHLPIWVVICNKLRITSVCLRFSLPATVHASTRLVKCAIYGGLIPAKKRYGLWTGRYGFVSSERRLCSLSSRHRPLWGKTEVLFQSHKLNIPMHLSDLMTLLCRVVIRVFSCQLNAVSCGNTIDQYYCGMRAYLITAH